MTGDLKNILTIFGWMLTVAMSFGLVMSFIGWVAFMMRGKMAAAEHVGFFSGVLTFAAIIIVLLHFLT